MPTLWTPSSEFKLLQLPAGSLGKLYIHPLKILEHKPYTRHFAMSSYM